MVEHDLSLSGQDIELLGLEGDLGLDYVGALGQLEAVVAFQVGLGGALGLVGVVLSQDDLHLVVLPLGCLLGLGVARLLHELHCPADAREACPQRAQHLGAVGARVDLDFGDLVKGVVLFDRLEVVGAEGEVLYLEVASVVGDRLGLALQLDLDAFHGGAPEVLDLALVDPEGGLQVEDGLVPLDGLQGVDQLESLLAELEAGLAGIHKGDNVDSVGEGAEGESVLLEADKAVEGVPLEELGNDLPLGGAALDTLSVGGAEQDVRVTEGLSVDGELPVGIGAEDG